MKLVTLILATDQEPLPLFDMWSSAARHTVITLQHFTGWTVTAWSAAMPSCAVKVKDTLSAARWTQLLPQRIHTIQA